MAAPTKEGLDYFPFAVDLLDNDDLDFLREKYGVVVNDVYIALLTLLYRKKGYYIPYGTETERKDCIWYVYKRVRGGKHPIQQGLIPIVIEAIAAQGLFVSGDLFNKIITSERAQKTYYKATVERKQESFDINPEFWLLDDDTMRKLSKVHPYYLSLHQESKSEDLPNKSDDYQSKSDEKPLKESKVNSITNVIQESKKENISINQSSSDEPPMREDGTYDMAEVENWERHRSHAAIMDEFSIKGLYRKELESFLRYCYLNKHIITNEQLTSIICRLDDHYVNDDGKKIKSLQSAKRLGYYDVKEN